MGVPIFGTRAGCESAEAFARFRRKMRRYRERPVANLRSWGLGRRAKNGPRTWGTRPVLLILDWARFGSAFNHTHS